MTRRTAAFLALPCLLIGAWCWPHNYQTLGNPYLQEFSKLPRNYQRHGEPLYSDYDGSKRDAAYHATRKRLTEQYSWAVPTQEAVETIARYSPHGVVDFGAGSGYWSSLVAQLGVDVLAIDDWSWGKPEHLFFPVEQGSFNRLLTERKRTLLLVWPPRDFMALKALQSWRGDCLIYVGEPEWNGMTRGTANPEFFRELDRRWTLVKTVTIPQWWNWSDALYVYKRER